MVEGLVHASFVAPAVHEPENLGRRGSREQRWIRQRRSKPPTWKKYEMLQESSWGGKGSMDMACALPSHPSVLNRRLPQVVLGLVEEILVDKHHSGNLGYRHRCGRWYRCRYGSRIVLVRHRTIKLVPGLFIPSSVLLSTAYAIWGLKGAAVRSQMVPSDILISYLPSHTLK